MNREQRRHLGKGQHSHPTRVPSDEVPAASRAQDELDPRTKSSAHGKKTADKWNQ
jgi:hypothetical protein